MNTKDFGFTGLGKASVAADVGQVMVMGLEMGRGKVRDVGTVVNWNLEGVMGLDIGGDRANLPCGGMETVLNLPNT